MKMEQRAESGLHEPKLWHGSGQNCSFLTWPRKSMRVEDEKRKQKHLDDIVSKSSCKLNVFRHLNGSCQHMVWGTLAWQASVGTQFASGIHLEMVYKAFEY